MSRCSGLFCLDPLTFHSRAVGESVRLSRDCRRAERTGDTFRNGLVFSNRAVKVQERVCVRVEAHSTRWDGSLRVGFTNVPPSAQALPLPCMAIPDLTDRPGHWVDLVHESFCQVGSELMFWVSRGGNVYMKSNSVRKRKLLSGVDLAWPLWAVIDIYGQTRSIFLQGSVKKRGFITYRSCPVPAPAPAPLPSPSPALSHADNINSLTSSVSILCKTLDECDESRRSEEIPVDKRCVVCLDQEAEITLSCGHRCLCQRCALRIYHQFGTCPLCRCAISRTRVSVCLSVSQCVSDISKSL
ncbi:E3 ubiquitin-protein ligase NEURL3 [Solea solea]|uniref:E3 ubiquitin-protein ligase NEURL3 n=1 Tax=Solea solea TaxID=90069 RepID=UPI00272CA6B8|nr:E3 ubiquitin-protein ligase NEURL3 [Solea solea]